jgi:dipeptidyl aminopeptidase/acylaminoacyl peptidase
MPRPDPKTIACAGLLLVAMRAQQLPAQIPEPRRDPRIDAVLDSLGKVRNLHQTAISPDGKTLAWVVDGERDGRRGGTEIEVAPLAAPDSPVRVTAGRKGEACLEDDVAWSPDSKTLAFLSDCQAAADHPAQADFYLAGPDAKTAPRRLTHLHGIAEAPAFSPDGRQLAFLYVEGATRRANPLAAEKPPAGVIGEDGLEIKRVATVAIPQREEHAPPPPGASAIHNLPLEAKHLADWNQKPTFVTPASLYAYEFDWSPSSEELAYVAAPPPGENNWWVAKLYTQHLSSDVPTTILDPVNTPGPLHGLQIAVPRWSPDGKQIAFIGGLMSDQGSTGGDIYVVNSSGADLKNLTPGLLASPAWLYWESASKLAFSEIASGESRWNLLDIARGTTNDDETAAFVLPEQIGSGDLEMSLSIAKDGSTAFVRGSFAKAPEVWTWTPNPGSDGRHFTQMTHYNDELKPAWGSAQPVGWTNDKFHVDGWLLEPANYDPTKKYPLIVYVHGGPSSAVVPEWPEVGFGPAPFAALGYFVLMPNPRGSYGQGEAFTQANRKDFGYGDLRDILAGVDAVTKSRNIDPERVGLTGWSYGGFMTMFAVTQTNRFRAAVAGAGIADWQSYYGQNSIDQWMIPFLGASVYDDPGVYAKMSAVNFIKNVKTPTLAVVGDRDGECPAPQSFEFWHALKAQHVPTQLVVYPDEGHHFVDPEHQRDVLARALAWFQKYMPAD